MHEWEYCTIDLNDLPRKTAEIDLLNDAGADGVGDDCHHL
jgi:hypothetical protein